MKKYITLLILLISISCKAQEIFPLGTTVLDLPNDDYYVKDLNLELDELEGSWIWQDGNEYLSILLEKFEMTHYPDNSNEYYDLILGKYTYSNNGSIISETTDFGQWPHSKLVLYYRNSNEYDLVCKDNASDKVKAGTFILTSPTTATLSFYNTDGMKIGTDNGLEWTLPINVNLIKQ